VEGLGRGECHGEALADHLKDLGRFTLEIDPIELLGDLAPVKLRECRRSSCVSDFKRPIKFNPALVFEAS
jgi:hypothetical protein